MLCKASKNENVLMNINYTFYRFVTWALYCLVFPFLFFIRKLFGVRKPEIMQRFGFFESQRPQKSGLRVWIHAASVGETGAACAIIDEITKIKPETSIILSTLTETGLEAAKRLAKKKIIKFLAPLDFEAATERSLIFFRPDVLVLTETELWPSLIMTAAKMKIKVITANGRLSESSQRMYKKIKPLSSEILSSITALSMISEKDRERIEDVGAESKKVFVSGNSKYDQALKLEKNINEKAKSKNLEAVLKTKGDFVIVAGSTRPGEEQIIVSAFTELLTIFPETLLIIAPRHIERTGEIKRVLEERDLKFAVRSDIHGQRPLESKVIILDTMGELASIYRLADLVFCGGSLLPFGGQNPLEPAVMAKPLLFGPYMEDFTEESRLLKNSGAAIQVTNPEYLLSAMIKILENKDMANEMGGRALALISDNAGAARRHAEIILRYSGKR